MKLKAQLEESIKRIEKEQEKNRILKEKSRILKQKRANNLLPKDLFKKNFGEDQTKYLRTSRMKKWSDDTIKKALKLRYAAVDIYSIARVILNGNCLLFFLLIFDNC